MSYRTQRQRHGVLQAIFLLTMTIFPLASCQDNAEEVSKVLQTSDPWKFREGYQDDIRYPAKVDLGNWMSLLEDTVRACKVSIPGTHDALTGMGFYQESLRDLFNLTGTSQVSTLREQLSCGLRFFDIRPVVSLDTLSHIKNLRCTHGISEINITFEEAIDQIQSFLRDHPREFVIVKIQHDNGMEDQMNWPWLMWEFMELKKYKDLFTGWTPEVTVGELRGHILFINRTEFLNMRGAVCAWPDEDPDVDEEIDYEEERDRIISDALYTQEATCFVQDYYKTTTPQRQQRKKEAVLRMLDDARQIPQEENIWVINHCSAYTEPSPKGYLTNASIIHPAVIQNLLDHPTGTVGIVAMDFACHDQVSVIINGGSPYASYFLYGYSPMSQSMTNLIIQTNFPDL